MNNAEKFKEVFGFMPDTETMIPVCPPRGVECPFMDDGIYSECHCELWWGREYKAPDNRNCGACKHRVMKVEVGKGTPPDHFWGCECCECEFEPTTKNDNQILEDIKGEILEQYWGDSRKEYFSDNDSKEYKEGAIEAADYIIKMIDKYKAETEET